AQRRLRFLIQQEHLFPRIGQLGGRHQSGQPGSHRDDVRLHLFHPPTLRKFSCMFNLFRHNIKDPLFSDSFASSSASNLSRESLPREDVPAPSTSSPEIPPSRGTKESLTKTASP